MTCPSCDASFFGAAKRCPECGAALFRINGGVIRTSAVLIASDGMQAVYPSIRDLPQPLRKRVEECTTGRNSGTIVIADRRGKEQIERAARLQNSTQHATQHVAQGAGQPRRDLAQPRIPWSRVWPALVALTIGAVGAYIAFVVRF